MDTRIAKQMSHSLVQSLCVFVLGVGLIWPMGALADISATIVIDGYLIGSFNELSGINFEADPSTYWETPQTDPTITSLFKRPQLTTTLRRPAISPGDIPNDLVWQWHQLVRDVGGQDIRRSFTLTISKDGIITYRYFLQGCWPSRGSVSISSTDKKGSFVETWTFTCEYATRLAP